MRDTMSYCTKPMLSNIVTQNVMYRDYDPQRATARNQCYVS